MLAMSGVENSASASEARHNASIPNDQSTCSPFMKAKLEREAAKNWDKFYNVHETKFFKDRHWTGREFEALKNISPDDVGADVDEEERQMLEEQSTPVLLEVGCGVGNMFYPLIERIASLKVHCFDFSKRAVNMVTKHPNYSEDRVNAFVFDLTQITALRQLVEEHPFGRPTMISVIFVLSAIPPSQHAKIVEGLFDLLQPGGTLLFRDYAKGDLAQARFQSKEKWEEPNMIEPDFFRRRDGTMTFFATQDHLEYIGRGLKEVASANVETVERINNNRKKDLVLRRLFVQAQWKKAAA